MIKCEPIGSLLCIISRDTYIMTSIGPQIPAHLLRKRDEDKDEEEDEEEEEDAYMPDLPPDLKGSTAEISDDDDIGPKPARTSQADEGDDDPVREFIERESRRQKAQEKEKEPKKLQREEWMLVPPSSSSLLGCKWVYPIEEKEDSPFENISSKQPLILPKSKLDSFHATLQRQSQLKAPCGQKHRRRSRQESKTKLKENGNEQPMSRRILNLTCKKLSVVDIMNSCRRRLRVTM